MIIQVEDMKQPVKENEPIKNCVCTLTLLIGIIISNVVWEWNFSKSKGSETKKKSKFHACFKPEKKGEKSCIHQALLACVKYVLFTNFKLLVT